jgi:hypothetical protein
MLIGLIMQNLSANIERLGGRTMSQDESNVMECLQTMVDNLAIDRDEKKKLKKAINDAIDYNFDLGVKKGCEYSDMW